MNVILVEITEKGLGCGTYAHSLLKGLESSVGYPCNLGSKAFNMILLLLKKRFGNEHGHIYIANARSLESLVQLGLNVFPDSVAVGLDCHASLNGCVLDQLSLTDDIRIPLGEILVH